MAVTRIQRARKRLTKATSSAKGYTKCQGIVAKWIRNGHTKMREDTILRCYACTGQTSRWYKFLEAGDTGKYNVTNEGGGVVHIEGSGVVGEDYRNVGGRLVDYTATSSQCGLKIKVSNATLHGKSILYLVLNGSGMSKSKGR